MSDPLVSVIVPLYNYGQYIGECIQSIINQDYDNWELFVINDASTDTSLKIATKMAKTDSRITVISLEENSGYSKAKNEGIIRSSGEFITCLDADDMFTKDSLSCRVNVFQSDPGVDFVHGVAMDIKATCPLEKCYGINPKDAVRTRARIHAQGVMLRRWIHIKHGLYDENLRSRSDKEMWKRILDNENSKIPRPHDVKIDKDVAYYRKHAASMMKYRQANEKYNRKVTEELNNAIEMRRKEITPENTRMLPR